MPFFIFMCKRARLTKIRRNFVKTSSLFMRKTSSLDKDNEDVCKIRNTFRQRRSLPYPRGREWKEGVSLTAGRGICQTSPCILRSWSLERLRGGTESRSTVALGNMNFVMEANFSTIGSKMGVLHVGASHKTRLVGMGLGRERCAE